MKLNINKLIKDDPDLQNNESVDKILEYIDYLEDALIEKEQSDNFSKELIYKDILSQIDISVKSILKRDKENIRFNLNENTNWKECIINLGDYIDSMKDTYKINL